METLRDVDTADDVNAWIESRFEAYADTGVYVPNELADVGWDLLKYSGYGSRPPKEDETRLARGNERLRDAGLGEFGGGCAGVTRKNLWLDRVERRPRSTPPSC